MKLSFYNYKSISLDKTKDLDLSKTTKELYRSCLFWALQNNNPKKTVNVFGRTRELLHRLERCGLVKTYENGKFLGASLTGDWELDTRWFK